MVTGWGTAHQDVLDRLAEECVEHLWAAYADYNGRTQGKSLPRARFASALRDGVTFEPEGYLFGVGEDGQPIPAAPRGMFSLDGLEMHADLLHRISDTLEALDFVEADPLMREALGPVISPEWLKVKRSEIALYDTTVSPWERMAYLRT